MCKQMDQIKADLRAFQMTGELPPAWEPEPDVSDAEFDRRVDEINRELEEIESGSVEPPRFGWLNQIKGPWSGEFPVDRAEDMDAAAVAILLANMRAGAQR